MEDLIFMVFCWALGVFTGMGLGSVIGGQREARAELARVRAWRDRDRSE